ncbi:hypothetical protein V1477_003330 [Vespula maculifrons]|uniref:Uncharacterized protein n=1 Tax=Vespula maculifrons TaxID=7453 RepID=A0ABD2CUC3_VESMC
MIPYSSMLSEFFNFTSMTFTVQVGSTFPHRARQTCDFYVDDLITATHAFSEAIKIRDEILNIASKDGFALQQWAFNEESLISDLVNCSTNIHIR